MKKKRFPLPVVEAPARSFVGCLGVLFLAVQGRAKFSSPVLELRHGEETKEEESDRSRVAVSRGRGARDRTAADVRAARGVRHAL